MTAPVPPDDVMQRAQAVFADVQDEFCDVKKILSRFEEWRGSYADSYHSAYISLCLPKLLNPIIRHQLLVWNPLKVHIVHELHLVPCIRWHHVPDDILCVLGWQWGYWKAALVHSSRDLLSWTWPWRAGAFRQTGSVCCRRKDRPAQNNR